MFMAFIKLRSGSVLSDFRAALPGIRSWYDLSNGSVLSAPPLPTQGLCQGDDIPLAARIDPTTPLAKVLFPWLPAPTLKAGQDRTPPPSTPPVDFGFFL